MNNQHKNKTILFVLHEACLTGATIVLFRYAALLKKHTPHRLLFLLRSEGPLEKELLKLGMVYHWNEHREPDSSLLGRVSRAALLKTGLTRSYQELLLEDFGRQNISLVYVNTIVTSDILPELRKRLPVPIVWHIHELELAIKTLGIPFREVSSMADLIVANSQATKKNLVANHAIGADKIAVHYPIIHVNESPDLASTVAIPENKFVVGSSGTAITRKGAELFIVLARTIEHVLPGNDFYFVWVGSTEGNMHEIEHDIWRAGLDGKVQFTGEKPNPLPWFRRFDVFLSTSKEESFGLACAEAAYLGKPVMGFAGTEGLEEVILGCKGILIPYMDVVEMAERLVHLKKNEQMREGMGASSRSFASGFTPGSLFNDWMKTVERMIN